MKGDEKVIAWLNTVLKNELTAINQYFLHSKIYKSWGLSKLAKKEYEQSIDEMKHADVIIDRIFFLDGMPVMHELNKLRIGSDLRSILQGDLELELAAIKDLRLAIVHCEQVQDFSTRDLFHSILKSEEEHVDWLEMQLSLIDKIGQEHYCHSQI